MTTLRQSIEGRIAALEAALGAEKARLASVPSTLSHFLDQEVGDVREFIRGVTTHLFVRAVPVADIGVEHVVGAVEAAASDTLAGLSARVAALEHPAPTIETKVYPDGSTATGVAPLPATSGAVPATPLPEPPAVQ